MSEVAEHMTEVRLSEHGNLLCEYRVLVALLGDPVGDRPGMADGKVRVTWDEFVKDVGRVEIYDYKRSDVPVEQVESWSFKGEPAVKREIVKRLNAVECFEIEQMRDEPEFDDLLNVKKWVGLQEDADFDEHGLPEAVALALSSMDWLDVVNGPCWVGLVRHWVVRRWFKDGIVHVEFFDPFFSNVAGGFTITRG